MTNTRTRVALAIATGIVFSLAPIAAHAADGGDIPVPTLTITHMAAPVLADPVPIDGSTVVKLAATDMGDPIQELAQGIPRSFPVAVVAKTATVAKVAPVAVPSFVAQLTAVRHFVNGWYRAV